MNDGIPIKSHALCSGKVLNEARVQIGAIMCMVLIDERTSCSTHSVIWVSHFNQILLDNFENENIHI